MLVSVSHTLSLLVPLPFCYIFPSFLSPPAAVSHLATPLLRTRPIYLIPIYLIPVSLSGNSSRLHVCIPFLAPPQPFALLL